MNVNATTICATLSVAYSAKGPLYPAFKAASPDESDFDIEITTSSIPDGSHITIDRCLSCWDYCSVYSGVIRLNSDTADNLSILFKYGLKVPINGEVSRLSALEELQGNVIPRTLGYGSCKLGTAIGGSAFIISEMFGQYVDCHLAALSRKEKCSVLFDKSSHTLISWLRTCIMNMFQKIHDCGLTPTSYISCYVLEDSTKSKFKLFNLSDFEEHQVCPKAMHRMDWKDVEENPGVICQHMMERAYEMNFWSQAVGSGNLGWTYSKPLPSSRIIQQLFPERLKQKYPRDKGLSDVAYWYFVHIKVLLQEGRTVDELKGRIDEIASKVEKDWIEYGKPKHLVM